MQLKPGGLMKTLARLHLLTPLSAGIAAATVCAANDNITPDRMLHVKKSGPAVVLRSRFAPGRDLALTMNLGSNRQINFHQTFWMDAALELDRTEAKHGVLLHGCGDDSTPWNLNGTYIGANHGCSDTREVVQPGHGLTEADLGGAWRDSAGKEFFLIHVPSPDTLWFLSDNAGSNAIWKFNTKLAGPALTNAATGATLAFQECRMAQLRPACRIRRQDYLADGRTPLPENAWTDCAFLEIAEEYDIINPAAILSDVRAHPGQARDWTAPHMAAVISNRIVYRFYPGGATVVRHISRALQEFQIGYMGFVQSAKLYQGKFDTHEYYIPKTRPFTQDGIAYNFQALQDYSQKLASSLYFGDANGNLAAAGDLPGRFIQFLGTKTNGAPVRQFGYALGYSPVNGLTRLAERARHAASAINLYTSSKSYPHAVDKKMGEIIPAGTEFDCTAYRQYFDPTAFPNATCVYWHPDGDSVMLYADYHRAVERDVLRLPAELAGKRVEVVEQTPSLTLHTADSVPADGLAVSVSGAGGALTARLR